MGTGKSAVTHGGYIEKGGMSFCAHRPMWHRTYYTKSVEGSRKHSKMKVRRWRMHYGLRPREEIEDMRMSLNTNSRECVFDNIHWVIDTLMYELIRC